MCAPQGGWGRTGVNAHHGGHPPGGSGAHTLCRQYSQSVHALRVTGARRGIAQNTRPGARRKATHPMMARLLGIRRDSPSRRA